MHAATFAPRIVQQGEQRTALHAQAEEVRRQFAVAHVHDRASGGGFTEQPADARTVREGVVEQPQFPQHRQPGGLEQEAGAYRAEDGRALEDLNLVAIAREQQRRSLAGGTKADDPDAQCRSLTCHFDLQSRAAACQGRKKGPACAGPSNAM